MPTFRKCPQPVRSMMAKIIDDHYEPLNKAGVSIDLLFAFAEEDSHGNPKGPALKHHGVPAAGVIKANSVKHRVLGLSDVLLMLDGDRWEELTGAERKALLDHELYHIELEVNDAQEAVVDSAKRPRLKMRAHDFEIGGFHEIVTRHGRAALEAQMLVSAVGFHGQLTFKFDKEKAA